MAEACAAVNQILYSTAAALIVMPGLTILLEHLEKWWAQCPKSILQAMMDLQALAFREQGDVGASIRSIMFHFARASLGSDVEDLRQAFAGSMLHWLRHGDQRDVRRACLCLASCHFSLGQYDPDILAALAATNGRQIQKIKDRKSQASRLFFP